MFQCVSVFLFFKQKTAYEMRISDWSSDVCSSDLPTRRLLLFVCTRFQDLFHSPSGVLFAFPSRYWFTIGRSRVFSLGGWSPHIQTGFHVSRPTCLTPRARNSVV